MLKAVLFDLFETLITESRTKPLGVSALAPELGCEREAFGREWKVRRPSVTVGLVSFRQALSDIASRLGTHADEGTLQRLCNERTSAKALPFREIEDQVLTAIDYLRSRDLRLGVISNCCAEDVAEWPRCSLASRFGCAVFSFEVGLAKPDPEIYIEATRRLRVEVSDTWFIGDGADAELSGATQAGIRAFKALWFLRRWPHFREERWSSAIIERVEDVVCHVDAVIGLPGGVVGE
jgi:putative hydrolase of the HAD superfamily